MREVWVTGIGVILPGCDRRALFWEQVSKGESQLTIEQSPVVPDESIVVGRVDSFDPAQRLAEIPERFSSRYHRELQMWLAALLGARDDAALDFARLRSDRVGLFDGSSRLNFGLWYDLVRREVDTPRSELYTRRELITGLPGETVGVAASLFKIRGPTYVFSGTCSSGAIAIGHAYREVAYGHIDVAFAGGHDFALLPPIFAMYRDAQLLATETSDPKRAVRPYVDHSTNAFGEGAVTLVLESRAHAESRGKKPIAGIAGYAFGNNGYHPTTVDVAGVRPAEIIRSLLKTGETREEEVGFVVGHGNAVHLSDVSEENYMRNVFGPRAAEVPLISTKPIWGHTLGASSAVNAAAAALMIEQQFVVPTINVDAARVKRNANHQANEGAERALTAGISMSYGMGGHNAAILFRRPR
ncbi:MAG: beta-ketoacyl-[acyl-carrier-protein] synthase family protein [Polyangiales bacterium]